MTLKGTGLDPLPQLPVVQPVSQSTDREVDGWYRSTVLDGSEPGATAATAKYDPGKYLIPGQDSQGHHERIYCRVQPGIVRQIEVLLRTKKFPFRTNGDVMRWCVWAGLKVLDRMEPTPNTFLSRCEAVQEILRNELYQLEYMTALGNLEKAVAMYVSMGAAGEARRCVAKVQAQFKIIEEEYWRNKMLKELTGRFGHLMASGGKAGLQDGAGGDGEASR
jgi:hypothetical protein